MASGNREGITYFNMKPIREFIKNLGKDAPDFFGTSDQTIRRWIRTGNVPMKQAERILAAMEAVKAITPDPAPQAQRVPEVSGTDPYPHLPINIDRRLPELQVQAGGTLPDVIEINPTEQSFGANFTRPGRVTITPLPPMKLRDEGGQKIAYVDNEPKAPTVLPPSIPREGGWIGPSEPLPHPKKEGGLYNEPLSAPRKTEGVPQK
jgi:hypothetical protein